MFRCFEPDGIKRVNCGKVSQAGKVMRFNPNSLTQLTDLVFFQYDVSLLLPNKRISVEQSTVSPNFYFSAG